MFDVLLSRGSASRFALLILAWAIFAGFAAAQASSADLPAAFDAANRLYETGKYREAAGAYQAMAKAGSASAALYYNLGNAFFKSGETGRALAVYRQAEQLEPRDPDLRANLQFVRSRIQGPTLAPGRWQTWLGRLTLNEWALLGAAALWSWLALLLLRQVRPAWKPALRIPSLIGGVGTVLVCGCLAAAVDAALAQKAIVIVPEASVRAGPLDESERAFVVHDGAELNVLDRKDDWLQVGAGERRLGWVKRDAVILWPETGSTR